MTEQKEAMRPFRMQNGPSIPWALAEVIYAGYSRLYGTSQSLERLNERGGFGWAEVAHIAKELARYPAAQQQFVRAYPAALQPVAVPGELARLRDKMSAHGFGGTADGRFEATFTFEDLEDARAFHEALTSTPPVDEVG